MTAFFKLTLIASALALQNAPAIAQDAEDGTVVSGENRNARTIYVYYNDLTLSSAADVNRLERRVRSAARTICFSHGNRPLSTMMSERECYNFAMDGAEPQIAEAVRNGGTNNVAARATVIAVKRRAG